MSNYQLTHTQDYSKISFDAMASPCEVLVRSLDKEFCHRIAKLVFNETLRIQNKFSRYLDSNLVAQMNRSNGQDVNIDLETYNLLEFANNLFQLSNGLFDITSGALRRIWTFEPRAKPPSRQDIESTIESIGFNLIHYDQQLFKMPRGMQIDFGGIGKEYAVDQATKLVFDSCKKQKASYLINFGGDLSAIQFDKNHPQWLVGVESTNKVDNKESIIKIAHGSVATSGNTKRFFVYNGKSYGHLLNPLTGYPIDGAPRSITAFANSCVLAGSYTSLAMLQGKDAESFLKDQSIKYICIW